MADIAIRDSSNGVLITGGSSGIGYRLAREFARHGYHLVLVARNASKLQRIKEEVEPEFGVDVKIIPADLTEDDAAARIFRTIQSENFPVDILVNNAGYALLGNFTKTDWVTESRMIRLNVVALTELTKLFLPEMVKQGNGRILNVASTASFFPGPSMAVYYATKAYVLSFSLALWSELKDSGVNVTTLCPGPTASDFQKTAGLTGSRMTEMYLMDAEKVAKDAYRGLMRSKRLVIPGFLNKISVYFGRLIPYRLLMWLLKYLHEKK